MTPEHFIPWVLSVALLTMRLTVAFALSPALSAYGVPAIVRVALVLGLATLTFAHRAPAPDAAAWTAEPGLLVPPMLVELLIGALLGLGMHIVFGAFALAGRLLDVQIGFGIGSIFDPVTLAGANVLGSLMSLLGIALFFVTDAYLALVQLIVSSIDVLPLGKLPAFDDPMLPLLAVGSMFASGVALAAPVAAALLLTDVAISVVSRTMPQVNVLILALPLKVIVGYSALALAVTGWAPLIGREFARIGSIAGAQ